ncbi:hypothetical protein JOY44_08140 [Phormidium sp. CLA17]|uniref:DUF7219 family protein n=1 Tax=Leptolyngbya sp. Cla-17 TaxID=2803751 RepID=UPI001492EA81|nr:hypothetical protein [Leptolyngbya sp. Cla-17]MBM0741584.1 hypothetical protein [Leptolyngbya sp. Cla-17]
MQVTEFLFPRSRYRGQFTPQNLMFNANLQEFSQKVSYICSLETNGKISSEDAYQKIGDLWGTLSSSKANLGIDMPPSTEL